VDATAPKIFRTNAWLATGTDAGSSTFASFVLEIRRCAADKPGVAIGRAQPRHDARAVDPLPVGVDLAGPDPLPTLMQADEDGCDALISFSPDRRRSVFDRSTQTSSRDVAETATAPTLAEGGTLILGRAPSRV
jgi:hypothetical protein